MSTGYALASTLNRSTDSTRMNGGRGAVRQIRGCRVTIGGDQAPVDPILTA